MAKEEPKSFRADKKLIEKIEHYAQVKKLSFSEASIKLIELGIESSPELERLAEEQEKKYAEKVMKAKSVEESRKILREYRGKYIDE